MSFAITDKDAFERATRLAVAWIEGKAGGRLPSAAHDLQAFDTRDTTRLHPSYGIRIDDHGGSIWAARIDEPGSRAGSGETWSTDLFVEKQRGGVVTFGAQLMVRQASDSGGFAPTRPRLVRDILATMSAEADNEAITEAPVDLVHHADAERLATLIFNPNRRLPILTIATDEPGKAQLSASMAANRFCGAAHIVALFPEASWEMTRLLGKKMSTFARGVRLYLPGDPAEIEDPFHHPLWLEGAARPAAWLLNRIAETVFPLGFQDSESGTRFWHIAQLRRAATVAQVAAASGSGSTASALEVETLRAEIASLQESLAIAEGLERIATANEKFAQKESQRFSEENEKLKTENYTLNLRLDASSASTHAVAADRPLSDYDDLEAWAKEILGPHIEVHARALKDCRRTGHPDMMRKLEATLIAIRDHWIPSRLEGGHDRVASTREALGRLGVEDASCFAQRDKAETLPEYSVQDGAVKRVLYDHFKYGNSRKNSEQFRIYYSWIPEERRLLIGKMPSHLSNDMS